MAKAKGSKSKKTKPSEITENITPAHEVSGQPIVGEMQQSYLDYAMSVIVSRALPDVRDGLKPVHRRILYAMWTMGLKSGAKFRKSATVVGEVLGKYHPHGDVAVYDSLVRLAQDFSMRYQLVNGHGNFGSMDGDSAAAMRYTEAKLQKIADEMLLDIERDTVDFVPNYDGSQKEPSFLPARLPNLLLNGTVGIAVGMATNIPPHNLAELCEGIEHLIENPDATVDDLLEFVKGPDFPTGGHIFDAAEIKRAYATGRGSIVLRGDAEIEEHKKDQFRIVISEIPYQVNKATMVEKIADLVRDKKLDGIKDIRDESNKDGVRVVVELKKESYPNKVLNRLYSLTQLQTTFHVNTLALVDGIQPRVLTLKNVFEEYIQHRENVTRRRTQFDLNKAEARAHILEGLKIALLKIDQVIDTIKKSKDKDVAKANLMKKFKLSELQSVAILEMRLQQLANMERMKVLQELEEIKKLIKELQAILKSKVKIRNIIKGELKDIRESYGDERRTKVHANPIGKFTQEDLIPKESAILMITRDGYIKRQAPDTFKKQGRGGKGVIGLTTKEEDTVDLFFATNTHADLLFFTSRGRVFKLKAYEVPVASRTAKGQALVNFLKLAPEETVSAVLPDDQMQDASFLMMITKKGTIKKVALSQFDNIRTSGLIAMKLKDGDSLEWAKPTSGNDDIMMVSRNGQSIRTNESAIRAMGRNAAGVRAMKLRESDEIVGMGIIPDGKDSQDDQLLVVTDNGYGKRSALRNYKVQGRGGVGIKTAKITPKTGNIISSLIVNRKRETEDLIIISEKGQVIRLPLKSVNVLGRATQGVRLMKFKTAGDKVASVTFV